MKYSTAPAHLRLGDPELSELIALGESRYPNDEWGSFLRFGWREADTILTLSLAAIDAPHEGDMDDRVSNVAFQEQYILRTALSAEEHPLGVGVFHSHPKGYLPEPSWIDDKMDEYYARYFADFAPGRPYVSLVLSRIEGNVQLSGRVHWRGAWRSIQRLSARGISMFGSQKRSHTKTDRVARLVSAFGVEAASRLAASSVAVVGAGGTGSIAIEVLARAGIGRLVIIDPDRIEESNLERVHGAYPGDASDHREKALVALEHVKKINADIAVEAYVGALPQEKILNAIVTADFAVGCTDKHFARLALSESSFRYLIPSIDVGVVLEGGGGKVTGQVIQLTRLAPDDPCVLCRQMVLPQRVAQEVMRPDERELRKVSAEKARKRGGKGDAYWAEERQLDTVGYLTSAAGSLAAGYAIGWLTDRFDAPFSRLQINLVGHHFESLDVPDTARTDCYCQSRRGWGDQSPTDRLANPPSHWPQVRRLV